jgi:hypothetical protein
MTEHEQAPASPSAAGRGVVTELQFEYQRELLVSALRAYRAEVAELRAEIYERAVEYEKEDFERWNLDTQAYNEGYDTACAELIAGTSTTESAKHRDIYPGDQDRRILWDQGYDDAVCAWRLGMEPDEMRKADIRGPSLTTESSVIHRLLDALALDALVGKPTKLFDKIRPDPRKYVEE